MFDSSKEERGFRARPKKEASEHVRVLNLSDDVGCDGRGRLEEEEEGNEVGR